MTLLQAAPTYRDGLHLPGTPVWLDPVRPQSISFVSHARHVAPRFYRKALSSIATAELIRLRSPYERKFHPLTLPFGQFFSLGNLSLELIPSGIGMGGAQLKIASNGYTTLYSRDIAAESGQYSTSAMPTRANRLILGTDGACSERDDLSRENAGKLITQFIQKTIGEGEGVLVKVPELGEAQELSSLLHQAGIGHGVDSRIARVNSALNTMGTAVDTQIRKNTVKPGEVCLMSIEGNPETNLEGIQVIELDAGSGSSWREKSGCRTLRFTALANDSQLTSFVEAIEPEEILTVGYHRDRVAEILRTNGWNASPLRLNRQLPLSI